MKSCMSGASLKITQLFGINRIQFNHSRGAFIYIHAHLGLHTKSLKINSQVQQWFIGSDQLPFIQSVVNFTRSSPGCHSILVLIQNLFLSSLSYVESLLHPIQFNTSFPHKPVRDVILITQKSQSAIVLTSFFNKYRLHCMYFY